MKSLNFRPLMILRPDKTTLVHVRGFISNLVRLAGACKHPSAEQ